MEIDWNKVDEMVLALLALTSFQDGYQTRAWKNINWDIMDRLFQQGYISDPKSKAKSITLSEQGMAQGKALYEDFFQKQE
jgi:hypothetical protein